jgi:predicted nucleotidyltransferase
VILKIIYNSYGSFASKSQKAASDIDIMIIGNPEISDLNEEIATLSPVVCNDI